MLFIGGWKPDKKATKGEMKTVVLDTELSGGQLVKFEEEVGAFRETGISAQFCIKL